MTILQQSTPTASWGDALRSLASGVQAAGQRQSSLQDQELFSKMMAVNPEFAMQYQQGLSGMQNRNIQEQERARQLQQQELVKSALADLYRTPGINPAEGLAKLSAVTGDPSYLGSIYKAQVGAAGSQGTAHIKNFDFYQNLSDEDKKVFSHMMRAGQVRDVGDSLAVLDQAGNVTQRIPKGLAPERVIEGGTAFDIPASPATGQQVGGVNIPPMTVDELNAGQAVGDTPTPQTPQGFAQGGISSTDLPPTKQEVSEARSSYRLALRNAGNVIQDTGRALEMLEQEGRGAAGWGASLSLLPESKARAVKGHIDSVKANVGIDKLLEIKAAGSGLGQVPQAQLNMLASTLGNLEQSQSVKDLYDNLARTQSIYADVLRAVKEDAQQYGIDTSQADFIEGFTPAPLSFDEFGRSTQQGGTGSALPNGASQTQRKRYNPLTGRVE